MSELVRLLILLLLEVALFWRVASGVAMIMLVVVLVVTFLSLVEMLLGVIASVMLVVTSS